MKNRFFPLDLEFIDREKVDTIDFKIRAIDLATAHGPNSTIGKSLVKKCSAG